MKPEDRFTHGDLPHWYRPGFPHFIAYRLVDTIPVTKMNQWRAEREKRIQDAQRHRELTPANRMLIHKQLFAKYDKYLDECRTVQWLADERIAKVVRENRYHHHGSRYELLAYSIMPNHVHVLLQPFELQHQNPTVGQARASLPDDSAVLIHSDELPDGISPLSSIMHSLKSYTANVANRILGRTGQFWQHESYDHWVRDIEELERIVDYLRLNPVRARLAPSARQWPWSSAADRFDRDGSDCGLISSLRDDWCRS